MFWVVVSHYRSKFLSDLRDPINKKGPTLPDSNGRVQGDGFCVCGLAYTTLGKDWKQKLGITAKDCSAIIKVNDTSMTFPEIASMLEEHDFKLPDRDGCEVHELHDSACSDCRAKAGQTT